MSDEQKNNEALVLVKGSSIIGEFNITVYIALLSLFTAMTTVATTILIVPNPATGGYFNLGDTFVMLSGFLLGPLGGFIAGGVGSAMGDIALGYFPWAPITFVVKGLEGMAGSRINIRCHTCKAWTSQTDRRVE